jgi:hypothetical protein
MWTRSFGWGSSLRDVQGAFASSEIDSALSRWIGVDRLWARGRTTRPGFGPRPEVFRGPQGGTGACGDRGPMRRGRLFPAGFCAGSDPAAPPPPARARLQPKRTSGPPMGELARSADGTRLGPAHPGDGNANQAFRLRAGGESYGGLRAYRSFPAWTADRAGRRCADHGLHAVGMRLRIACQGCFVGSRALRGLGWRSIGLHFCFLQRRGRLTAKSAVLKTAVRKDLWVRIPPPPFSRSSAGPSSSIVLRPGDGRTRVRVHLPIRKVRK